ncbi:MAG: hypothetical protein ACXWWG_00585 [Nitrospira sp.]
MASTAEIALRIVEVLDGEGNADVESVRAVQQVLEMVMDDLKVEAIGGQNTKLEIFKDLRTRCGAALFEGKGAVEMTKGEFILAWQENLITGIQGTKGTAFMFMGVPVKRKELDG